MFAVRAEQGVTPGRWVLLDYKGRLCILAGNLPDLDWRRSTEIEKVEIEEGESTLDKTYHVTTRSGSEYVLHVRNFGLSSTTGNIVDQLTNHRDDVLPVLTTEEAFHRLEQYNE